MEQDARALANDALSEEQMRHWPACRAEGYTCGVHAEPWPCHFARLVDAVTLLTDALDESEAALDRVQAECDRLDALPFDPWYWTDATDPIRAAIEGSET